MCKYCEEPTKEIHLHRKNTNSNIPECFIHKASDGAAIFLRGSFIVKLSDKLEVSQDNDYVYMDIEYCPFCGRKL